MSDTRTSIAIDAPAETVWSVPTDFEAYPEWNPRTRIEGEPRVGERFVVEELEDGRSRLTQSEEFSGLLARPVLRFVGEGTEANSRGVDEAPKTRAESLAGSDAGSAGSEDPDGTVTDDASLAA